MRRFHLHSGLLIGAGARARQTEAHASQGLAKPAWCKLCDKAVDREELVDGGNKRAEIRVECHGSVDGHRFEWDSDSEGMDDALRVAREAPFFDFGPLPTEAARFYDSSGGAKSE